MNRIIVIPPGRDFIEAVASCVSPDTVDLRRHVVVFPGKRPGHFLLRSLARRIGAGFFPPRIASIDEFVDLLHGELPMGAGKALSTLDAVSTLFDIHQSQPRRPGGRNFMSFSSFFPLGLKLFGELEELVLADISPRRFRDVVGLEGRNEFFMLADLYEAFSDTVTTRRKTTRATRYRAVCHGIDSLDLAGFDRVILAGILGLTQAEQGILWGLARRDNIQVILQDGPETADALRRLNVNADSPPSSGKKTVFHFHKSPDTHAQVFAAAAVIRDLLQEGEHLDEQTVIVLPDSGTLFPVLQYVLPLLGLQSYNISLGYPLTRTPVFGFLNNLMQVITSMYDGRLYAPDYLKFVLHPFTKNIRWREREEVTRIMFHGIEEWFADAKAKRFFALEELERDEALVQSLAHAVGEDEISVREMQAHLASIHHHTIRRFLSFQNIGSFVQQAAEILSYVEAQSSARRYWLFAPFFNAISRSLDAVASSALSGITLPGPSEYFRFLRSYLESVDVPFHGTPLHGVQVLGFLETRNIRFRRVIMFDASDDVMPGSKGHQLIPARLRVALGIPTTRDRERSIHHDFSLLVSNAEEVHFFFTEHGRKEKSRFLEELLWMEQREGKSLASAPPVQSLQYATRLTNTIPAPVTKTSAMTESLLSMPVSTTALDTYLHCGLKFLYRHVLNLREKGDVSGEIARAEIGIFVHKILAEFLRPAIGVPMTVSHLDHDKLDRLIDSTFLQDYGDESIRARFLLKNQIKRHLQDFVTNYQIPMALQAAPVVEGVESQWRVTRDSVTFTGHTDRVERRGSQVFILDYKTGSRTQGLKINFRRLDPGDRATWPTAIGSLQLPLYMLMYHYEKQEDLENIVPAYLMLGRHGLDQGIELRLFQEGTRHRPVIEMLEQIILDLVEEIRDPGKDFHPATDLETECPRCPFTTLCGTRWIEARQSF